MKSKVNLSFGDKLADAYRIIRGTLDFQLFFFFSFHLIWMGSIFLYWLPPVDPFRIYFIKIWFFPVLRIQAPIIMRAKIRPERF